MWPAQYWIIFFSCLNNSLILLMAFVTHCRVIINSFHVCEWVSVWINTEIYIVTPEPIPNMCKDFIFCPCESESDYFLDSQKPKKLIAKAWIGLMHFIVYHPNGLSLQPYQMAEQPFFFPADFLRFLSSWRELRAFQFKKKKKSETLKLPLMETESTQVIIWSGRREVDGRLGSKWVVKILM